MFRLPRYDAGFWRACARFGATRLPRAVLRHSPGPIGIALGAANATIRAQVLDNLRLIHGPRSGARTSLEEAFDVAATFASFGHCLAEGLAAGSDEPPHFRYALEGREHLMRAKDDGRGAVLVTGHLGSWDVAGSVMVQRGFDLAIAMAPERDVSARAISDAGRVRAGIKVFHVGADPLAALPLARHVREGGAVALQIDRVPEGMRAVPTRLFGAAWALPIGPFQLAQATGAPILPLFTARLGYLHHLVVCEAPIRLKKRPSGEELAVAVQQVTYAFERFVARFPTQWFHFAPHPRVVDVVGDVAVKREAS